jgi:hypothetical protein
MSTQYENTNVVSRVSVVANNDPGETNGHFFFTEGA